MAISVKKIDINGKSLGDVELSSKIFDETVKDHLVYDSVVSYLASQRQGTAKTKGRAEVSGGGKKPYKQKGTGNARQGTIRAPNYPGGGRVFGPTPRNYKYELPKKMRRQALRSVLNQKAKEGKIFVFESAILEKPESKRVSGLLKKLELKKALIVDQNNKNMYLSSRNIKNARYVDSRSLNVYDILKFENLLLSTECLRTVEERLSHED